MALTSAALLSCATGPVATQPAQPQAGQAAAAANPDADYAELQKAGGRLYRIDPRASDIRIFVFRGGPAARFGHNHILTAPRFEGRVLLPKEGVDHVRFDLVFRLDQLEIDPPALVDRVGEGFATVLSADSLAGVRAHMLGERNMQADRYPLVRIRSLQVEGETPAFAARVEVEMHGRRRDLWLPLQVRISPGQIAVDGRMILRQTDFDITPYAVLGGLLAVRDPVLIEFRLVGHAVAG